MPKLTQKLLLQAVAELSSKDRALGRLVERYGPPPMWGRRPSFSTLTRIILEQQVSLTSANAVFLRLKSSVPALTPEHIEALSFDGLRNLGFTRQKADYCQKLAHSILTGDVELNKLNRMDDETAHAYLLKIKGIGPWTANIYLLMALKRPDIWPDGDLALAESVRRLRAMNERPSYEDLNKIAKKWRPWRSVAARILWHAYLSENK